MLLILPTLIVVKIALSYPADSVPPYAPMLQSDGLHISTDAFALILSDPLYARALLLSLKVAGLSTAICLLAGYPMALAIARSPERWRSLLLMLVMLPFWTGFLMRINAWIGLLQDDGWINTIVVALGLSPLRLLYTDTAMYIGIVYTYLPFMVLPLYARLSQLDVRLLEAAADLGAPPWRVFLAVTLPLSLPGVWAGMLLVFIPAAGEYVIPDLLGGPQAQLIGRVLWQEFFQNSDWPTASAIACALLVLLLLLPGIYCGCCDGFRCAQPILRVAVTAQSVGWVERSETHRADATSLHLRQPLLRHRAPRRIRRRFGQSATEQRRRFLGDVTLRLGDRLGCLRGDRRIEPHGKRGPPGIGRLLQPAAARFGIAEQDVALMRLFAVRIEFAEPPAKLRDQRGLLRFPHARGGDPIGERHGGQSRRTTGEIQRERAKRHHQQRNQHRRARACPRPRLGTARGGEQPALHLQHRIGVFRRGDASVGEVAIQFRKLRAVQRDRRLLPAARGGGAAQRQCQRRQRDRRKQGNGEPDHDFSRSARRCRSASLSGAGGAGRRRRAISAAAMPASSAMPGAPHSTRVTALNGGRRRTKSP